ncbi:glutathione S-transferase family protein [Shewanella sp. 4_MG-2023]|uniref:glutathione S-transferase family protein n=1 Tax=Shewanella sp. 4_MG-2023 TaxID=3062652 RepID=UPI0026E25DCD|nr:glutathione S-transferase family protein [Shewanella sp. 4_MG-2023]MDO6680495.1 glutathione S-transferase family protein [Shewanella sp. 4_MG-2023]
MAIKKSGNYYKIKLTLALLNIDYQWQDVDIMAGGSQTKAFLAKNPNGKLPIIELDDGRVLAESNAIIGYLAAGSRLIPDDKFNNALMYQWLFFEQYSHEPCIAVARFIKLYQGMPVERQAEFDNLQIQGGKVLKLIDNQLAGQAFMLGELFSLADIALYAYTHVAHEGGFDLSVYPNFQQWLANVESQAGFVSMLD